MDKLRYKEAKWLAQVPSVGLVMKLEYEPMWSNV